MFLPQKFTKICPFMVMVACIESTQMCHIAFKSLPAINSSENSALVWQSELWLLQ